MNDTLVCPKCNHDDRISKVSSIVKSQTRTRKETEWVTETYRDKQGRERSFTAPRSFNVVEITDLAKRLSPPERPLGGDSTFLNCLVYGGLSFFLGFILFAAVVYLLFFWFVAPGLTEGVPPESFIVYKLAGVGISLFCCLWGVPVVLYMLYIRRKSRAANKVYEEIEIPKWNNAMYIWDQLYYCARDDIVFIPGGTWVSSSNINELLYEPETST